MRLLIETIVEVVWEVAENALTVIDRYRSVAAALGWSGDSVVDSLADIACMIAGFLLARHLPTWVLAPLATVLERVLLATIRDNLAFDVMMLVAPDPQIVAWQQDG